MSERDCNSALSDLEEYLRNEPCKTKVSTIAEHLKNCTTCHHEAQVAILLTKRVHGACQEKAPEELRAMILRTIRSHEETL